VPAATYKDLCIDANDARLLGEFWAATLDLELQMLDDGDAKLTGPTPQHTVWINTVPEPVTVKQRMHLDVNASTVDDVLALGATPLDLESFSWKVLRDPEGGEVCVFERGETPASRLLEIVVDCADGEAERLATWWADVLGGTRSDDESGRWSSVEGIPGAPFDYLVFVPVPEPKTVKNRIHIDVTTADVDDLVSRGATVLRPRDEQLAWTVMADPAGNEFCAFTD
jgi:hypothetical protein